MNGNWRHCPSVGRSRLLRLLCESLERRGADSNAVLRPRRREGLKEIVSTPAKTDRQVAVRRRRETSCDASEGLSGVGHGPVVGPKLGIVKSHHNSGVICCPIDIAVSLWW